MNANIIRARLQPSHLAAACFPLPASRDPERQENQSDVEPESGTLHVQTIESELARPRDVARRVDVRQPGEARPHRLTLRIAGNLIERDQPTVAAHVDFAWTEWPRSDEAHIAAEDVYELRQFVHRRGAQHAPDAGHSRIVCSR